jgi:hypothetical protein
MGRKERETELSIPGQEKQVNRGALVDAVCPVAIACKNVDSAHLYYLVTGEFRSLCVVLSWPV